MKTCKVKKERLDLMIDLETTSCKPNAGILSISVVPFRLDGGKVGEDCKTVINQFIDVASIFFEGHDIDKDTQEWWSKQKKEVRDDFTNSEKTSIQEAITYVFSTIEWWCDKYDVYVWSKGTDFDFPILEYCFDKYLSEKGPYKYWQKMDVRTYISEFEDVKSMAFSSGSSAHRSIDDCYHQIQQVQAVYNKLKNYRDASK